MFHQLEDVLRSVIIVQVPRMIVSMPRLLCVSG